MAITLSYRYRTALRYKTFTLPYHDTEYCPDVLSNHIGSIARSAPHAGRVPIIRLHAGSIPFFLGLAFVPVF